MTDDQLFLANGLIDDELDAHQRELAESDPEVMREVAALLAQRAELRNVAPASGATRSAALAAALEAWSPASEAARDQSVSTASVTPLQPRPPKPTSQHRSRWTSANRLLGAAAAVVGLGLAGLVISRTRVDQTSDGAAKEAARSAPIESGLDSGLESATASAVAEATSGRSAAPADGDSAGAPEAAMSDSTLTYSLNDMSGSEDSAMASAATDLVIVPMPTLLFGEQDLRDAVDSLIADPSANETSNDTLVADALACEIPSSPNLTVLGETTASNDDPVRPTVRLIILTDSAAEQAYAVDAQTCLAVQAAPLLP